MIKSYMKLAGAALNAGHRLFRVRPKMHALHHVVLQQRRSKANPTSSSTWIDEDMVKKSMRIKKQVHKLKATEHLLRRYVLGLPTKLGTVAKELEKKK